MNFIRLCFYAFALRVNRMPERSDGYPLSFKKVEIAERSEVIQACLKLRMNEITISLMNEFH